MEKMNITDFKKRKLKNFYITLYVVTKEIKIRTEFSIENKIVYVLIGVDIMGARQILGTYFDNEHDNRFWLERFEDIKARGVNKILFFVTPVNKNIERCIKILYNNIQIVYSPDIIYNSITKFFSDKEFRKMKITLKDLFLKENIQEYKECLNIFKEVYIKNKIIQILLAKKENEIEKFYNYNYAVRKLLYPYYTIRQMQKFLNKLKYKDNLCKDINEVIEMFLPYINSFELGRTYSKIQWLELISDIYENYKEVLEEELNV